MTRHDDVSNIEDFAATTPTYIKDATAGIAKAKEEQAKGQAKEQEADEKVKAMCEVAERLAEYKGAELDIHIDSSYKPLRVTKGTLIKAVEEKKREKKRRNKKGYWRNYGSRSGLTL